ncbi:acyloxyacyl hydrolase [Devosia rhodophyticola]|uniref:Acyloxyacyl hydrolase n=1 Tax=Devosia rhodophyticola TaxID=3026423 RepID=A0ABY7YTE1_9HYPH|nr:acyloxyacyl hydrolase [Devosia rhodophyticola]WDR04452.1 acyloxyacyl hydrolase [Devosia rhodophyticola]
MISKFGLAIIGALSLATPALAQDLLDPNPLSGVVDELRIGFAAHNAHYALLPSDIQNFDLGHVNDLSFDVLFVSPDVDVFRWIGSPRPEIGTTINFAGQDSIAHLSLTWQLPLFDTPLFLEGSFGAAAHNGYLTGAPAGRKNFGCRVNFYERYGLGWNISDKVTASLQYEHTSNWELCSANAGLSNVGVRFGHKF